ncbi:MAG: hypothetical protein BGP06_02355 [Rhizobiales bacterium 65-9]|nr:MAG: hypothetical protein BGP06_02355 [Rhizobiales bacterium 65-9]
MGASGVSAGFTAEAGWRIASCRRLAKLEAFGAPFSPAAMGAGRGGGGTADGIRGGGNGDCIGRTLSTRGGCVRCGSIRGVSGFGGSWRMVSERAGSRVGAGRGSSSIRSGSTWGAGTRPAGARTMADSTSTSFGPPIMTRCSTLSRRISSNWRWRSTSNTSTIPSRGCRPRPPPPTTGRDVRRVISLRM